MTRTTVSTGAPWEKMVGYSRAVRAGNLIEVAGTTATENGETIAPNDPAEQTRFVLNRISQAITELGGTLHDVTRTRIFVTDISHWEVIGNVHGEFFGDIRPAATMVEVSRLIQPDLVVEIEATAWIDR
ncbi:MAG: RidA family protein [Planctomycetota bacterium]